MISKAEFRETIVEMINRAETTLPSDVQRALKSCLGLERKPIAKLQLKLMLENMELAKKMNAPICQDTGTLSFFIKSGCKLDFDPVHTIRQAVKAATLKVPLRSNAVDPLTRMSFGDNVGPWQPTIHFEPSTRRELEIDLLVKGAGSENYSRLFMLRPSDVKTGIWNALSATLSEAGGKICPPVVVGIGVGGNAEVAALLAKKALLRSIDKRNPDPKLVKLERELERDANKLGIGPMGLGGRCTVLRVLIESAACHTASLPVGIAFNCWVARRSRARMVGKKLRVVEV